MEQPIHILTQMGVLTSFSVAKKVTEGDITEFFKRHKKTGKTEEEIGILLREKIFEEIREALVNKKIPGLLTSVDIISSQASEKMDKNLIELNKLIMVVANKLIEKKYDKMSLCYFINSLVNALGLTEKDFENFHRKMSSQSDDGDDNEDDNEDDD